MPFAPGSTGRKANTTINNAVRDGKMKKPSKCQSCGGGGPLQGHHTTYNKLGKVRWLCQSCHTKTHGGKPGGA